MKDVVFITGNQKKADYLTELLGQPIEHIKINLEEIQSLDLKEVVAHKVRQAYVEAKRPVLVEDVSLECVSLGKLPGTFIKWFLEELSPEGICRLLDGTERGAITRCMFGYFDGMTETYFESNMRGIIAENPARSDGFGWDTIFIPEGYSVTRAELSTEDDRATYLKIKPIEQVAEFLTRPL